jgi:type VII secretion integral membrane protein EccD
VNTSVTSELCRLRFHAQSVAFELAVPSDVPLLDLLPAVLNHAGPELMEQGVDHGGWVLQRLGEAPLDEERTPEALGLRDGETLYLRHRLEELPTVHFDDMVDGVTTGMRERGRSWSPAMSHHLALALSLAALGVGLGLLLLPGPHPVRTGAAALVGVVLVLGAASASRAVGDAAAGTALGAAAVPYLALAGALFTTGAGGSAAARLLAGGSAAAGTSVLALAAVGCSAPLYLGLVLLAVVSVVTGVLMISGESPAHVAALAAVVAVVFGALAPALSFRLSGLRLPALPRNADELQEGIDPIPAGKVLGRSRIADGYLTAFYLAVGVACAGCLALTAWDRSWWSTAFTAALCVLLLLHGRAVGGLWQRLAVVLPGALGLLLLAAHLSLTLAGTSRLMLLGLLLAATAALAVTAWSLPGRRLLPYWGRIGDMLHTLSALSLLPLALQGIGVYAWLRGLGG